MPSCSRKKTTERSRVAVVPVRPPCAAGFVLGRREGLAPGNSAGGGDHFAVAFAAGEAGATTRSHRGRIGLSSRRGGVERLSPPPRALGNSCALWRNRAVATRNRRLRRGRPPHRDSASIDAGCNAARIARAALGIATPSSRVALTNCIKHGVFLRDAGYAAPSAGNRRRNHRRCRAHPARPAMPAATAAGRNFFATGC